MTAIEEYECISSTRLSCWNESHPPFFFCCFAQHGGQSSIPVGLQAQRGSLKLPLSAPYVFWSATPTSSPSRAPTCRFQLQVRFFWVSPGWSATSKWAIRVSSFPFLGVAPPYTNSLPTPLPLKAWRCMAQLDTLPILVPWFLPFFFNSVWISNAEPVYLSRSFQAVDLSFVSWLFQSPTS